MLRSVAVTRIQDGLGFASRQSDKIILRLQEAQRELEKGKTLPRFLLQENELLTLVIGTSTVTLPARFLRVYDDTPPYYIDPLEPTSLTFLRFERSWKDIVEANYTGERGFPKVGYIGNTSINFINLADATYSFFWSYYKGGEILDTDIENSWLANAPDWLIGEAGWRMAMDLRDKEATANFDMMRKTGRAAVFGEIVAAEEASGPLVMGASL